MRVPTAGVPSLRHVWLVAWVLATAGLPAEPLGAQQSDRDSWQRVPDVLEALNVAAGSRVADIGAGSGYFTRHLGRRVGSEGRVFAVEISESQLSRLRALADADSLKNIEVVRGDTDDPRLPEESQDAVLVVDAYHEMIEYESMLAGMYRALRPGGRLVILDLTPQDGSDSRDDQTDRHRISIDRVEREVRDAGFEVLDRQDQFARTRPGRWQWMLVARRPGTPGG